MRVDKEGFYYFVVLETHFDGKERMCPPMKLLTVITTCS